MWDRRILWYLVTAGAICCAALPSWPVVAALVVVAAAAFLSEREAQATHRKEVLAQELITRLAELEAYRILTAQTFELHNTRIATVENRTRPVNGGR